MWKSKGRSGGRRGAVKLKGQLYLLRTGQTEQHRSGIFFLLQITTKRCFYLVLMCMRLRVYVFQIYVADIVPQIIDSVHSIQGQMRVWHI